MQGRCNLQFENRGRSCCKVGYKYLKPAPRQQYVAERRPPSECHLPTEMEACKAEIDEVMSAGRQLLNSDDFPTQSRAVMSPN